MFLLRKVVTWDPALRAQILRACDTDSDIVGEKSARVLPPDESQGFYLVGKHIAWPKTGVK